MACTTPAARNRIPFAHPCFDSRAHTTVGRVHLPVASVCNIQCAFCGPKIGAHVNMRQPGSARELISARRALALVRDIADTARRRDFVVGVAGPGEPLANAETFEALAMVHREFPSLVKCVSTNGLLLEQSLPKLLDSGVRACTVTVNATDESIGRDIYAWVRYGEKIFHGQTGAKLLLCKQMEGIKAALRAGLLLKINTVLIPGVNERHLPDLASRMASLGVPMMNIMPLIPAGGMSDRRAPTRRELHAARRACEHFLPQFRECEQCRADIVCLPWRG